jgi:geranylgeranyl diphosphate synthase type II
MESSVTTPQTDRETASRFIARRAATVEAALDRFVPPESTPPATLHRAMRYSLLGGGKRLRPILVLAAGEACGAAEEHLLPIACAVEMIHTYSLVHDDLPAMDNDDLRRGRPTSHRVFGEAMAILAGDALLTQAFLTLAQAPIPDSARVAVISTLATAIGAGGGMIGGQVDDLEGSGKPVSLPQVERIHQAKTGALIRASAVAGGLAAGASGAELQSLEAYGSQIGVAFQIVDDLLDLSASSEQLGKTPGKDAAAHKATFPAALGVAESERRAQALLEEAVRALGPFGPRAAPLEQIARFVVQRQA